MPEIPATPSRRDIFAVAWPLGMKAMMMHGIIAIDAYLVSSLGEPALAAMGLAGAIGALLLGFQFAFSSASQIRIAQAFGSGETVPLKTGFYIGLLINLILALLGIIAVLLFGGMVLRAFAHTPWIAEQAQSYLLVFLAMVVLEAFSHAFTSLFNGSGKTTMAFYSQLISIPVNIGVSIVLIHGLYGFPAMGVTGAAVGTAVAAFARAAYLAVMFWRITGGYLTVQGWRNNSFVEATKRHLRFALPIATTFCSVTITTAVCAFLFAKMSVNEFAAITLIMPWIHVAGVFAICWAQATGIIVAQLLGGHTPPAALDAFLSRAWRVIFVSSMAVSLMYLAVCLSSGWIYSELQDETRAALMSFLPILLVLPYPKGSNAICGNTLRAGGDTVYVMNIFLTSQWLFRIPLTALFILYWDLSVTWVFALLLAEELVKFPAFHLRLYKRKWQAGGMSD
ncbi:MATE family efflux transporter [Pelagimonas varians]|uniref:Multidrug efflux protein n=1 Tax=Pelagimonas varians TaxID=696760 RepID=A0A238K8K4_9RHOB|nr:MATE family efflux transporter [Pelagimonas varians]PYG31664.1 Na+-driven multidrug efflux pump [Pelagimonas varians]SMX38827.1 multidrug efflux protein [Pelagimonas varians]